MNKRFNYLNAVITIICYLYILLFVYAATSKMLDFEVFQVQLRQSPLLGSFAGFISWAIPSLEIIISLCLIFPKTKYWALYSAFGLMMMFSAYIYIILHYSSFVPCSCGGILEKMDWNEHLIFNLFFVLLAIIAIKLLANTKKSSSFNLKFITITLVIITFFSIGTVASLYKLSEDIIHHNNNFTRRFEQHPIRQSADINLEVNSYYFAGADEDKIYLANASSPSLMTVIDTSLNIKKEYKMQLDNSNFPFRSIQIKVKPPYFYVLDGTVPCIFKGNIVDWKAKLIVQGGAYFDLPVVIDSTDIVFRTVNPTTKTNILGNMSFKNKQPTKYATNLLQKQIDGIFDTDGTLNYSEQQKKIVYTYYYRNQFVIADKNLKLLNRGNTIDTTKHANLKVAILKKHQETKLNAPPVTVNKNAAINNNLLFVNSDLPGRYESESMWKQAAVIDIYNINDNSYLFSSYIHNIDGKKMKSFIVTNTHLFALIDNHLVAYRLMRAIKKEYTHKEK